MLSPYPDGSAAPNGGMALEMRLAREYIHSRRGYRFGSRCCWVRLYEGETGDAPVVVCEETSEIGAATVAEMSEYLAAEVVEQHLAARLPELPRPLLWIEHRPGRGDRPGGYRLLDFPSYEPRPLRAGFVKPVTLGVPSRESVTAHEVAYLIGQRDR